MSEIVLGNHLLIQYSFGKDTVAFAYGGRQWLEAARRREEFLNRWGGFEQEEDLYRRTRPIDWDRLKPGHLFTNVSQYLV